MGILLGWQNLLEAAGVVLASSSEAAGLGIRSVLTPQLAEVWRSGAWGASTVDIDVDLGSAQGINVVAVGAPRDGRLPAAGATVSAQGSTLAALSRANLQGSPGSIVIDNVSFSRGVNATDLGAVTGPLGAAGARRFGSASATGANCWVGRSGSGVPMIGGQAVTLQVWARVNGTPLPTRGTVMTVDEYNGATFLRRWVGPSLLGADATWRQFSTTITTRSDCTALGVFWVEGWQTGAQVEFASPSLVKVGETLNLAAAPLTLAPLGVWAWASSSPILARYLRLSFTGTAADAYLQLGRVWAGPALITGRAASYGHRRGAVDPGRNDRAGVSGLRVAQRGQPYRVASFAAQALTAAEALQVEAAALAVGTTGQVFAARNHLDLAGSGMFGAFTTAPPETERTARNLWRADFTLEEDL